MVSTVELNVTTGKMLHQLAARAVITDYENGVLDDDKIQHQVQNTLYFYLGVKYIRKL